MRATLILAAAAVLAAAQQTAASTPVLGHFSRAGAGLSCAQTREEVLANRAYESCLRIGPLRIGLPRAEAEQILGRPFTSMTDPDGETADVYVLAWPGAPGVGQPRTYAAVIYGADHRAKMIQLTGQPIEARPWALSGIGLGASEAAVGRVLGEPFGGRPEPYNQAVLWNYRPWPISFEVKGGKVVSIRVEARAADGLPAATPPDAPDLFKPLLEAKVQAREGASVEAIRAVAARAFAACPDTVTDVRPAMRTLEGAGWSGFVNENASKDYGPVRVEAEGTSSVRVEEPGGAPYGTVGLLLAHGVEPHGPGQVSMRFSRCMLSVLPRNSSPTRLVLDPDRVWAAALVSERLGFGPVFVAEGGHNRVWWARLDGARWVAQTGEQFQAALAAAAPGKRFIIGHISDNGHLLFITRTMLEKLP